MDKQIEYLLFEALNDNILPLTGRCNLSCIFCSHRYNPPDALVYDLPPLNYALLSSLAENLDPSRKIVLGESATRLREGEPFTHGQVMELLQRIRELYPKTPLQITTNGTLLTKDKLKKLASLQPIELIFSLNSISATGRNKLCGDREAERAITAVKIASSLSIPFHGSVVAMPHILGYEDLRQTLIFLNRNNALTIRVFIPGFTRYTPDKLQIGKMEIEKIRLFIGKLRSEVSVPVLLEPPLLSDTEAVVEGILSDTPAAAAGLMCNDRITAVNDETPLCRVDAYNMLFEAQNPEVKLERDGISLQKTIKKERKSSSGVAVNYDINPAHIDLLKSYLSRDGNILLLTSEAAAPVWQSVAHLLMKKAIGLKSSGRLKILSVPSEFWGGSIICAGLLTVADFRSRIEDGRKDFNPDIIMLPPASFDRRGKDITGVSYRELAALFAKDIRIIV